MKNVFLLWLVLISISASGQRMDEIRRTCFYNIPFSTTATFTGTAAYLDARKDSFLLISDTAYVHDGFHVSYNRVYVTQFKDAFTGVEMRIEINGYGLQGQDSTTLSQLLVFPENSKTFSRKRTKCVFRKVNSAAHLRLHRSDRLLRKEIDGWNVYKVYSENGICFYNVKYRDSNEWKLLRENS